NLTPVWPAVLARPCTRKVTDRTSTSPMVTGDTRRRLPTTGSPPPVGLVLYRLPGSTNSHRVGWWSVRGGSWRERVSSHVSNAPVTVLLWAGSTAVWGSCPCEHRGPGPPPSTTPVNNPTSTGSHKRTRSPHSWHSRRRSHCR